MSISLQEYIKQQEKRLKALKDLAGLKSADAVAAFLVKKKIKGNPDESSECPLANYLNTYVCANAMVGIDEIGVYDDEYGRQWIKSSPAIKKFIDKFDSINGATEGAGGKKKSVKLPKTYFGLLK